MAWAAVSLRLRLARIVRLAAAVVFLLIALAILLRLLNANASNSVVHAIHDAAGTIVGPFKNMFSFSAPKTAITVNWGIAAIVYLIAGLIVARVIATAGRSNRRSSVPAA